MVGCPEDALGAAEVLGELDDAGAGVVALEVEDVADVRAAPAVDRLVGVADDAEVGEVDRHAAGDAVLGLVGVLVLVDEDVAEAGVEFGAQLAVVAHREGGHQQQVVEVEGVGVAHLLLVVAVDLRNDLLEVVVGLFGEAVGGEELVLRLADGGLDGVGGEADVVDAGRVEGGLGDAQAVGLVVDGEVAVDADAVGVLAQQAHAEAVEGADEQPLARQHRLDAVAHLAGGLVGERDGEDLVRLHPLEEEMGDAAGDDARLARPRPRQHEQRPVHVQHRLTLHVGQGLQPMVERLSMHPAISVAGRLNRRPLAGILQVRGANAMTRSA